MTRPKDAELKAMGVCVDALKSLDEEALDRVLAYLVERFQPGCKSLGGSFEVVIEDDPDEDDGACAHPWHDEVAHDRLRQCPDCGVGCGHPWHRGERLPTEIVCPQCRESS